MIIQATVPSALGRFFTRSLFDQVLLWAGPLTAVAIMILWGLLTHGRVDAKQLISVGLCMASLLQWRELRTPGSWRVRQRCSRTMPPIAEL
jgi:hypothetical protein